MLLRECPHHLPSRRRYVRARHSGNTSIRALMRAIYVVAKLGDVSHSGNRGLKLSSYSKHTA